MSVLNLGVFVIASPKPDLNLQSQLMIIMLQGK